MTVLDLRELPADSVLHADLCIIGAGAAGITIARTLSGRGLDVIVLESGGRDPDDATQALYAGHVVGEPLLAHHTPKELDEVRLRFLGGTTNHWAGYCRRLEPVDFERRSYLATSGWPLNGDELAPWYEQAAGVIGITTHFELPWWQENHDVGEALLDGDDVDTRIFQVRYPYTFASYTPDLEAATDVRLVLWANVTNMGVAPESDQVEAVTISTLDGRVSRVEARAFVVASGGIENARLLLASNDVRARGLGNENDLVGRFFTEHLQTMGAVAVLNQDLDTLRLHNGVVVHDAEGAAGEITVKGVFTLPQAVLVDNGLLGLEAQVLIAPPAPESPEYVNGVSPDDVALMLGTEAPPPGTSYAIFQVLGEQELDPESRITLADDRDALGVPRAALDWRHSELDRRSIVAGLQRIGEALGRGGLGRVQLATGALDGSNVPAPGASALGLYQVDIDTLDLESFPIGIGFHHMCTTRMADSPTEGVVDRDCRVHDLANLFVAGSSVFATGGTATPTFTITALALRLADHLHTVLSG